MQANNIEIEAYQTVPIFELRKEAAIFSAQLKLRKYYTQELGLKQLRDNNPTSTYMGAPFAKVSRAVCQWNKSVSKSLT
jgi:hypothetical protein